MVDNFFGGDGRYHAKIEGREFTPTERRIVQMLLKIIFEDYKEAEMREATIGEKAKGEGTAEELSVELVNLMNQKTEIEKK